jgi:hypothetical protein
MITATVSGSFHRHMHAITAAVHELASLGVRVLSPADPRIVAAQGEFLFVASDPIRSVRLVQDRHLESIQAASFLWLVCPDGYVGQSASMEIGFAAGAGVPILSTCAPSDLTLREYVTVLPKLSEAVHMAAMSSQPTRREGLLVDPHASIEQVHQVLEKLDRAFARGSVPAENEVQGGLKTIRTNLAAPTTLQ